MERMIEPTDLGGKRSAEGGASRVRWAGFGQERSVSVRG
jgi:hypothetical protein